MLPKEKSISKNRLIAKNATMLYIRMFISMGISFYTSRMVLQALGVSDYGIYNLVGGIIVLVNMLNGSLSKATSRFLTYALGEADKVKVSRTFSTALIVHIILSCLFLIVAETIGLWFVNTQLVIPIERVHAANWVFQVAVFSTVLGITQSPYNATITAHENFGVYAYIDILSASLKLIVALFVLFNSTLDNLKLYAVLYGIVSISIMLFYRSYCIKHYPETRFKFVWDKAIMPEMLRYSGWNLFGSVSLTISQQGSNIIYNWFFGTIINAAIGVAGQVQVTLNTFASNINTAFVPQIIKEYAQKNFIRVNELINMGVRFTSLLTILISVPVFVKMDFLMSLWLHEVPEGAVVICQILLIRNYFNSFNPLPYVGITATGKVASTNLWTGILYLISLLICYLVLKFTRSYVISFAIGTFSSILSTYIYLKIFKRYMPNLNIKAFIFNIRYPMTIIFILSLLLGFLLNQFILNNWLALLVILISCSLFVSLLTYIFILDKHSREYGLNLIKSRFHMNRATVK